MFEVDLVETCGDLLSLALEEALPKKRTLVVGPKAKRLKFLDWKPKTVARPMELDALGEYDLIVCIQCLPELDSLRIININNKTYAARGSELIDLTQEQSRQAHAFMKKAGIKLKRGESTLLPLELHSFLGKVERALTEKGQAVFIDQGDPDIFDKLTLMEAKHKPFSRFLAETKAGKMHVVNCNPYLSKSPHFIRDSSIVEITNRLGCGSRIIPWLDIENKLGANEKELLEPFMIRFSSAFLRWSDLVLDYKEAANRVKRDLTNPDSLTELYATSFVLGNTLETGFIDNAWVKAEALGNLTATPPMFALRLQKVYK